MIVWVTRDEPPDGPLSTALWNAGLEVVHEPVIEKRICHTGSASEAISRLSANDWLVLTSPFAIEAAITVRLVRLDDQTEEEWAEAWGRQPGSGIRIRDLVEQPLPVPEEDAEHYGVEVALGEADQWNMVWAARSDTYKRRELKKAAAPFVQRTMIALIDEGLLP